MKKFIFLLLICPFFLQSMAQNNFLAFEGRITDIANGNPVVNHPVTVQIDSAYTPGYPYYNVLYTDNFGYYRDSLYFSSGIPNGVLMISTYDCNQVLLSDTANFSAVNRYIIQNFHICTGGVTCNADFTWQSNYGLTAEFQNNSTGGGYSFWNFGDGTTSTLSDPSHTFPNYGYYNVLLRINDTNYTCIDSVMKVVYVSDSTLGGCQAAFSAIPDSSNMQFTFIDHSTATGSIISWSWSFGDGASSSLQNPVHTYQALGSYIVCLTIQGADSACFSTVCDTVNVGTATGCQAYFAWVPNTITAPNIIRFYDQSQGGGTSWHWSFGDSTYASIVNPVHTYLSPGIYHVCLTITSANPYCTSTWCTDVSVSNVINCENNFNYMANWLDLTFEGHMLNGFYATYSWNFGDGTSGSGQTVNHSYNAPGYYTVSLTTVDDSTECTFTSNQTIQVGDSNNLQQVYGQVFEGNFPLESGLVMIFSVDTGATFIPYSDIHVIDSAGIYYFPYVPQGNYVIWAIPFDSLGGYLPTFYGDVIWWEQATVVNLGVAQNPYPIHLVQASSLISGPGGIGGQVNTGSKSLAVDKITMLLMNEQGQPVGFRRVSPTGSFDFSTLSYGTYYLKAELPGCTSDMVKVVISGTNPVATVNMTFSGNGILGINDPAGVAGSFITYPNPFNDIVNISLNPVSATQTEIEIFNLAGQRVNGRSWRLTKGENRISIDLSDLKSGMYTLRITSTDGINLTRKLVKTR